MKKLLLATLLLATTAQAETTDQPPVPVVVPGPSYAICGTERVKLPDGVPIPQSCEDLKRWNDPLSCYQLEQDYWALRAAYCKKVFRTKKQRNKCMAK